MWTIEVSWNESPQQWIQTYDSWRGVAEDFNMDSFPQKRNRIQNSIKSHFDTLNIPTRDIHNVQNDTDTNFIIVSSWKQLYYFDIYSEQFCWIELETAKEFRENNPNPEIEILLAWIPLMQKIVENDSWYLDGNESLIGQEHKIFSGMNIREIQMTLRGNIRKFELNWGLLWIDPLQRDKIAWLYRIYLEIIMGIGDSFEKWSAFFHKTEWEIDLYTRSTIFSFSSPWECVGYYTHIQTQIFDNSRSSKKNKESYKIFSEKLWRLIFERLKRDMKNEKDEKKIRDTMSCCVYFIKLITERTGTRLNNDLRNPELAEEICIFIISRDWWVLDSIEKCSRYSLDFTDPVVWKKSPTTIVNSTKQKLQECGIQNPDNFLRRDMNINTRLLLWNTANDYNSLSLEHKRQISILARLLEKIDSGELSPKKLSLMSRIEASRYIIWLGREITQEAFDAVQKAYDKNFETESYWWRIIYNPPDFLQVLRDVWLPVEDIEAFELFNDIRWNWGFMNFSDENLNLSWSLSKSAWIIIGTIAVVMIATAVTWWLALPAIAPSLIASWGWLTTTWSLISIWSGATLGTAANIIYFDPRWHDSFWEMIGDVWSDFAINTFHAVYMERLTMALWKWSSAAGKAWLLWGDLWSWIGIEVVREKMLDALYQSDPLLWKVHEFWLEEAFWWLGYEEFWKIINPKLESRFKRASHIFYLWNWHDVNIELEEEFSDISWSQQEILSALNLWIQRQENRIR